MVEDIRNFRIAELESKFQALGLQPYRARQVFGWLYQKKVEDFGEMKNLPQTVKERLLEVFEIQKIGLEKIETSKDLTQKFLFRLKDNALIESVSIPAKTRLTACLSTQVGCKFSCAFCASGSKGLRRNLEPSEILAQFLGIEQHLSHQRITNVVFMGVGEPLDNYDHLLKAVHILNTEIGVNLGIRKMTISTCGLVPGIERLSREGLEIELSVSLHSAVDEKRSQILPVNRKYPLAALRKAVSAYIDATHRKVTFEYVLLGGYNTAVEDAQALARYTRSLNVRVNLIPYNPSGSGTVFQAPAKPEVFFFKSYLLKHGVDVTLRAPRGIDISAACGQLKFKFDKARSGHGA
ncbi:MAG: 23S rRNA (adenine(2503)-C(2))-methyltransferase RlmN [Candidatus Omnitrophota bacterium]